MSNEEQFICKLGGNVPVKFSGGVTEFSRDEPCPGCKFRRVIDFKMDPAFEVVVDLVAQGAVFAKHYYDYFDAKQTAQNIAMNQGGIFMWEKLTITRYPPSNKITCSPTAR